MPTYPSINYIFNFIVFFVFMPFGLPFTGTQSRLIFIVRLLLLCYYAYDYIKFNHTKSTKIILFTAALYGTFNVISNINSDYSDFTNILTAIVDSITILGIILWITHLKNHIADETYFLLHWVLLVYIAINATTLFLFPEGIREYEDYDRNVVLFLGGKFDISYYHIMYIALLHYCYGKKLYILLFSLFSLLLEYHMNGATGGVIIFLTCLYIVCPIPLKPISKPLVTFSIVFLLSIVLLYFQDVLYKNEIYRYLTEDVLGKDTHMTGRAEIYLAFAHLLEVKSFMLGVGNSLDAIHEVTFCGNLQNEYFQKLYQTGVLGLLSFISYIYVNFSLNIKSEENRGWITVLTCFLIASLVEIPFNAIFILFTALIPKLSDEEELYLNYSEEEIINGEEEEL